jgi:hypothetical protein
MRSWLSPSGWLHSPRQQHAGRHFQEANRRDRDQKSRDKGALQTCFSPGLSGNGNPRPRPGNARKVPTLRPRPCDRGWGWVMAGLLGGEVQAAGREDLRRPEPNCQMPGHGECNRRRVSRHCMPDGLWKNGQRKGGQAASSTVACRVSQLGPVQCVAASAALRRSGLALGVQSTPRRDGEQLRWGASCVRSRRRYCTRHQTTCPIKQVFALEEQRQ